MKKKTPAQPTVRAASLDDLKPDALNANVGTQRGRAMLESSVRRYGMGRSILADKHGRIIAGNKTAEAAGGAGIKDTIVVPTDGSKVVVVQRTDLDLDTDVEAKELAIADNQANAIGLKFHGATLAALEQQGVDMRQFFRPAEYQKLVEQVKEQTGDDIEEMALQPFEEYNYIMCVFKNSQDWQGVCDELGIKREAVKLGETTKVGLGRVVDGGRVLERLRCPSTSSFRRGSAPTSSKPARSHSSRTRQSVSAKPKRRATAR